MKSDSTPVTVPVLCPRRWQSRAGRSTTTCSSAGPEAVVTRKRSARWASSSASAEDKPKRSRFCATSQANRDLAEMDLIWAKAFSRKDLGRPIKHHPATSVREDGNRRLKLPRQRPELQSPYGLLPSGHCGRSPSPTPGDCYHHYTRWEEGCPRRNRIAFVKNLC